MISPVQFNGMIQNTNNVADIRAGEEQRPQVNQQNATVVMQQHEEQAAKSVQDGEDTQQAYDFSRGGNGSGDQSNRKRKKKQDENPDDNPDGFVRVKGRHASFDIKI